MGHTKYGILYVYTVYTGVDVHFQLFRSEIVRHVYMLCIYDINMICG